jgi:2-polyprenyl-3-methyl-5-hydroxy-6-metoxy-1,4-benzoquinol methylase
VFFFDQFPRFYRTSSTAPETTRLNLRYEAIFGENRDIFEGASVLDLASHDGRWSLAALAAGARSVTGIEARPELVKGAAKNLAEYGYQADRARFITGDVHQVLTTQELDADVVLCLGFLYHTLRYNELLNGIRKTNARYLSGTGGFASVMVPSQIMRSTSARMNQADCMEGCAGRALTGGRGHSL